MKLGHLEKLYWSVLVAVWANFVLFCLNAQAEKSGLATINAGCILVLIFSAIKINDVIFKWRETNGLHRRADQEVHSDTDQRANAGDGTKPDRNAVDADDRAGTSVVASGNTAVATSAARTWPVLSGPFGGARPASGERTVERAGIILGEVKAYRCWNLAGDYLVSMNGAIWIPGIPMRGIDVDHDNTNGVHAFKHIESARGYPSTVIGVVKLWGTIIEHETGYRAEFAKPVEIIETHVFVTPSTLQAIARRYGLDQERAKCS